MHKILRKNAAEMEYNRSRNVLGESENERPRLHAWKEIYFNKLDNYITTVDVRVMQRPLLNGKERKQCAQRDEETEMNKIRSDT